MGSFPTVQRATFEVVLQSQKVLLELIARLMDENRSIKEDERWDYLQMVARGMLGQGIMIPAMGGKGSARPMAWGITTVDNAEDFLRFMAYLNTKKSDLKIGETHYTYRELWGESRRLALKTFPLALSKAMSISAEHVYGSKSSQKV